MIVCYNVFIVMARIIIIPENPLSPDEAQQQLKGLTFLASPTESLLQLIRQLTTFEAQYKLPSDLFYARFMRGEMGDALPFIQWAGRYEMYLETRQHIDQQLAVVTS